MASDNKLNEDDIRLFRETVGPVQSVVNTQVATTVRSRLPQSASLSEENTATPSSFTINVIDSEASYLRAGHSPQLLKRLRRMQIADAIDLHQMTTATAQKILNKFLDTCQAQHRLCIKIIHGKGLRSKTKTPVLKHATYQLLQQRTDVLAYVMAKPAEGGSGAVIVLLKK